jgi:PIN like domain
MSARINKSKKRSVGSERSLSLPEDFVLYLDENLCNSTVILETLTKLGVRFERHLTHFSRGTLDESWLPLVGRNGWVLLTADKRIRYNLLEKRALDKNRVREFVFTSGNMSGQEMAEALEQGIRKMANMCSRIDPPFVAASTRSGEVHLRWPKK